MTEEQFSFELTEDEAALADHRLSRLRPNQVSQAPTTEESPGTKHMTEESQALFVQVETSGRRKVNFDIASAEAARELPTKGYAVSDNDEDVSFLRELERENQALERELKAI